MKPIQKMRGRQRVKAPFNTEAATSAIVGVGPEGGRGFIMHGGTEYVVVTAAHCLPRLPPAHPMSYLHEKTYPKILGPLNAAKPTITAECIYVDPVADIAVLAEPDSQELSEQWEAFNVFVEAATIIQLSKRDPADGMRAWLLSPDGQWGECRIKTSGRQNQRLWITDASSGIVAGMSGSPILMDDGKVLGLISVSGGSSLSAIHTEGGPQPRLAECLPKWILRGLVRTRHEMRNAKRHQQGRRVNIPPIKLEPRRKRRAERWMLKGSS